MATSYKRIEDTNESELENLPFFVDADGMVWLCEPTEDVASAAVRDLMRRVMAEHKRRTH
jgi:hypothetical protein